MKNSRGESQLDLFADERREFFGIGVVMKFALRRLLHETRMEEGAAQLLATKRDGEVGDSAIPQVFKGGEKELFAVFVSFLLGFSTDIIRKNRTIDFQES
jgi:hypothetical protein